MTTSIPSTDEEVNSIEYEDTSCCCTINFAAICVSLHGIILTLLLPLTVRGPIGGQYGVLISSDNQNGRTELIDLTHMSFAVEMFLIGLVFFAHLIGFISVIKKWMRGLVFYCLFHFGEIMICFFWLMSVLNENIKSHLMSQYSLGWYCFFAFVIEFISIVVVFTFCCEFLGKKKDFYEELPIGTFTSTVVV